MKVQIAAALEVLRLSKLVEEAKLQADNNEVVISDKIEIKQSYAQKSLFFEGCTSNNKGPMVVHMVHGKELLKNEGKGVQGQMILNEYWKKARRMHVNGLLEQFLRTPCHLIL